MRVRLVYGRVRGSRGMAMTIYFIEHEIPPDRRIIRMASNTHGDKETGNDGAFDCSICI